jgi:hypothetical protein
MKLKCWWHGHDWRQVSFDTGHCKRCDVELRTLQMSRRDLYNFIHAFRAVVIHVGGGPK